jgi:hypothetical protein
MSRLSHLQELLLHLQTYLPQYSHEKVRAGIYKALLKLDPTLTCKNGTPDNRELKQMMGKCADLTQGEPNKYKEMTQVQRNVYNILKVVGFGTLSRDTPFDFLLDFGVVVGVAAPDDDEAQADAEDPTDGDDEAQADAEDLTNGDAETKTDAEAQADFEARAAQDRAAAAHAAGASAAGTAHQLTPMIQSPNKNCVYCICPSMLPFTN